MSALGLDSPVSELKGIGKTKKALFDRIGAGTVSELLLLTPSDWIDTTPVSLERAAEGGVRVFKVTVLSNPASAFIKGGGRMVSFSAGDGESRAKVCFRNQPYAAGLYSKGDEVLLMGRVTRYDGKLWCFSPARLKEAPAQAFLPTYRLPAGLSDNAVRSALAQVIHLADGLCDPLPEDIRTKNGLMTLGGAVRQLHFPESPALLAEACRRTSYDSMLKLALKVTAFEHKSRALRFKALAMPDLERFWSALPFEPTDCQRKAALDIAGQLCGRGEKPVMNRLLQGDVGSGKTVVAAAACYICAANGFNSLVMAPTQILASQHYEFFSGLFSKLGIRTAFLSGSSKKAERELFNEYFSDEVPVIGIGTHALLEEGVPVKNAALAVADEQQRFGVEQRSRLAEKCLYKNTLVMSATPIPRSLALFLFSPENVSVLDQLPPGRKPVETYLVGEDKKERLTGFMEKLVSEGGRCYVVCPLIDPSEDPLGLKSAVSVHAELSRALPQRSVAILHGRQSDAEKNAVMADFAEGRAQVLVSTTVIEVGVNVPEANLMVIMDADRFGLSQLHQLRGRVGRGSSKSYCVLVTSKKDNGALSRLKKLCETSDGFEIAGFDLEQRGPGEFFGTRQSGKGFGAGEIPPMSVKEDALTLWESHPDAAAMICGEGEVLLN